MDDNEGYGPNHWSWWGSEPKGGFCLNQASAETMERIRAALDIPPAALTVDVEASAIDPEAVGALFREILRNEGYRGA